MNCHAKRLECVPLAGAVARQGWFESGSKLRAFQTLRAVRWQRRQSAWRLAYERVFPNPKGIAAFSPGLRGGAWPYRSGREATEKNGPRTVPVRSMSLRRGAWD